MLSKELARGRPDDKIHLAVSGTSFENIRKFHPDGLKKVNFNIVISFPDRFEVYWFHV